MKKEEYMKRFSYWLRVIMLYKSEKQQLFPKKLVYRNRLYRHIAVGKRCRPLTMRIKYAKRWIVRQMF